jgi:putative transposase
MARATRIRFRGATYHVMSRGNRKNRIFEDHRDRRALLEIVQDAVARHLVECLGYCLMDNHYHFIVHTPNANISQFMKLVNGRFTQYINRRHKLTGHVFEGRFKAIVVDDSAYLRSALAYVARNPVEAGLVADAELWHWSSYAAALGLCAPEPFLNTTSIQRIFPSRTVEQSRHMFKQLVTRFPNLDFDETAIVLGDKNACADVRELIGMTMYLSEIPRSYKALGRPDLRELLACVTRSERAAAIRRAHVVHGYLLCEIARCLEVHPSTISRLIARSRPTLRT